MLSMTWDQLFLDYLPPQVLPANPLLFEVPEQVQKLAAISGKMSWKEALRP